MQRIKQTLARWANSTKPPPSEAAQSEDSSKSLVTLDKNSSNNTTASLAGLHVSGVDTPLGPGVLYGGDDAAADGIDIVFVHDLHGHREESWTKSDVCWPRDLLGGDIPGMRVISWGWSLGAPSERALSKMAEESSIADRMLDDLVELRRGALEARSLIFVAHGHGGLVVKEAVSTAAISRIYGGNGAAHSGVAAIYAHLLGVMFLGTVHLAVPGQTLGQTLAEVACLDPRRADPTLARFLEARSEFFEKVVTDFNLFTRDVQIVCIQEDRPTPDGQMVTTAAATYEAGPNVTVDTIRADHFDIARFARRSDSGYFQILGHLSRVIQGPSPSEILDLLYFEGMFEKENSIDIEPEYKSTCSQTLSAKAPGEAESAFHRWSDHDHEPIFWVTGRPGCGKSTLMKYAFHHDAETQRRLERWAGEVGRVIKVMVCLFEDGTQLQQTHEGILRSTLYQMLSQRKDLLPAAFPTLFRGPWPPRRRSIRW
ncbi:hypothetical protein PG988_012533 [Apiospora saccharicola]